MLRAADDERRSNAPLARLAHGRWTIEYVPTPPRTASPTKFEACLGCLPE